MELKHAAIALFTGVAIAIPPITAKADVPGIILAPGNDTSTVLDQTLNQVNITGGQQADSNLFHSFGQFNLQTGEVANFVAPANIENILGRVTGGIPSNIDGILQVTGANANLYLMNPAGILFGPNAQLNISAAFTATTANGIGFGSNGANWFNAFGENNYANLTGNPTSYAFAMAQPAAIINNAANLRGTSNPNISLIGGTVVSTVPLTTSGGVTIATVPGSNLVRVSQKNSLISLEFSPLSTAASQPNAAPLSFNPLSLPNLLTGSNIQNATGLSVNVQGQVQLTGSGLNISSGDVVINGGINTSADTGNSGDVVIRTARDTVINGEINTSKTENNGDGGNVVIHTERNILINNTIYTYTGDDGGNPRVFGGTVTLIAANNIELGNINVDKKFVPSNSPRVFPRGNNIIIRGASIRTGNINAGDSAAVISGDFPSIGSINLQSTQGDIIAGFIVSGTAGIEIDAQRYFRATEVAFNLTSSGSLKLNPESISFPDPLITFREFVRNRVQGNLDLINYFSGLDLNEDGLPDFTREQLQNPDTLPSSANFNVQIVSPEVPDDVPIPISVVAQSRGGESSSTSINITHGGQAPKIHSNIDSDESDVDQVLIQGRGQNFSFEVGPRSISFERVRNSDSLSSNEPNFVLFLTPVYQQATIASNTSGTVGAIGVTREGNGFIFVGLRDIPISQITRTPVVTPPIVVRPPIVVTPPTEQKTASEVVLTRNTLQNLECSATSQTSSETEGTVSSEPCGISTGNILRVEDNQTPAPNQNQQSQIPQALVLSWASKPIPSLASDSPEQ